MPAMKYSVFGGTLRRPVGIHVAARSRGRHLRRRDERCSTSRPAPAGRRALVRRYGCRVIGLDQSADMLAAGSRMVVPFVRAQARRLPFADESFDHVTFTYLLRYVDGPVATLCELARVLRPGGRLATLILACQPPCLARPVGLYTRTGLHSRSSVVDLMGQRRRFPGTEHRALLRGPFPGELECTGGQPAWKLSPSAYEPGGGTVMSSTKDGGERAAALLHRERVSRARPSTPSAFFASSLAGGAYYWTLAHPRTRPGTSRTYLLGAAWRCARSRIVLARFWLLSGCRMGALTPSTSCGDDHSAHASRRRCWRHSEP